MAKFYYVIIFILLSFNSLAYNFVKTEPPWLTLSINDNYDFFGSKSDGIMFISNSTSDSGIEFNLTDADLFYPWNEYDCYCFFMPERDNNMSMCKCKTSTLMTKCIIRDEMITDLCQYNPSSCVVDSTPYEFNFEIANTFNSGYFVSPQSEGYRLDVYYEFYADCEYADAYFYDNGGFVFDVIGKTFYEYKNNTNINRTYSLNSSCSGESSGKISCVNAYTEVVVDSVSCNALYSTSYGVNNYSVNSQYLYPSDNSHVNYNKSFNMFNITLLPFVIDRNITENYNSVCKLGYGDYCYNSSDCINFDCSQYSSTPYHFLCFDSNNVAMVHEEGTEKRCGISSYVIEDYSYASCDSYQVCNYDLVGHSIDSEYDTDNFCLDDGYFTEIDVYDTWDYANYNVSSTGDDRKSLVETNLMLDSVSNVMYDTEFVCYSDNVTSMIYAMMQGNDDFFYDGQYLEDGQGNEGYLILNTYDQSFCICPELDSNYIECECEYLKEIGVQGTYFGDYEFSPMSLIDYPVDSYYCYGSNIKESIIEDNLYDAQSIYAYDYALGYDDISFLDYVCDTLNRCNNSVSATAEQRWNLSRNGNYRIGMKSYYMLDSSVEYLSDYNYSRLGIFWDESLSQNVGIFRRPYCQSQSVVSSVLCLNTGCNLNVTLSESVSCNVNYLCNSTGMSDYYSKYNDLGLSQYCIFYNTSLPENIATCWDGLKNGYEIDVDYGSVCGSCENKSKRDNDVAFSLYYEIYKNVEFNLEYCDKAMEDVSIIFIVIIVIILFMFILLFLIFGIGFFTFVSIVFSLAYNIYQIIKKYFIK